MSLTLLNNPQKQIIICVDEQSFFESDVSELDFRWTLPNQQSETKNIIVTNISGVIGTVNSIILPSGFFTTQTFPQTVLAGQSLVIPIYFLASTLGDYSNDTDINGDSNVVTVSLLAVVQSKGLQFDGVNDYVISTQDVNWERSQAWTMFFKYKNINWTQNSKNPIFSFYGASRLLDSFSLGGYTTDNTFVIQIIKTITPSDRLLARILNRSAIPSTGTIQIVYNGTSNTGGIRFYANNVENTGRGAEINTLTSNIVTSGQKAIIGQIDGSIFLTANSVIQEISFVNYFKSDAELTADYNAGFQSKGSGDWLFRQSFNVGGTPLNLKADVLGGLQVDTTIIGQTTGDFVNF